MVAAAIIRPGLLGRPEDFENTRKCGAVIVTTREPGAEDAAGVAALVRRAGTLEPNTNYAYVLLCTHFAGTCAIAESEGQLVGCALGYRIPEAPSTLFVWQIGVDPTARRMGIARRLLDELLRRPALDDIDALETTIAPSNEASLRLFQRWSELHDFPFHRSGSLASRLFDPEGTHEAEHIYRIGPIRKNQ